MTERTKFLVTLLRVVFARRFRGVCHETRGTPFAAGWTLGARPHRGGVAVWITTDQLTWRRGNPRSVGLKVNRVDLNPTFLRVPRYPTEDWAERLADVVEFNMVAARGTR